MTKYKFHELRTTNQKEYNCLRWKHYKKEIDRSRHWKEEAIREILENLISSNQETLGLYSKGQIEKAIIQVRGIDQRTIKNWFKTLWKLEYLVQPKPTVFQLNYQKIASLDVKLPPQIDPLQTKLRGV